jgi:plasmid maintenance system killer protein
VRRQAIAQAADNAGHTRDLLARHGIDGPTVTGAGGFYSIRINDQWRVIFRWSDGDAAEVQIVDYH